MDFDKRMKAKKAMTPKAGQGFNVVGIDTFEDPGEELYLIANVKTRAEAEKKLAAWKKKHLGEPAHIYGPEGGGGEPEEENVEKSFGHKYKTRTRDASGNYRYTYEEEHPLLRGNLGIKRQDMPQIFQEHLPAFVGAMKGRGIKVDESEIAVGKLKATQSELHMPIVHKLAQGHTEGARKNLRMPVITSSDGYVLDGHHRWAALHAQDPKSTIRQVRIDLPITALLKEAGSFQKVGYSKSMLHPKFAGLVKSRFVFTDPKHRRIGLEW